MIMKPEKVYVLQHSYDYGENDEFTETKFIGVYSSESAAEKAVERLYKVQGFDKYPKECFNIDAYTIDEDNWTEGFIKMS